MPLPDEQMIEAIERRCGLSIPADVRDHLLRVPLGGDGLDGGGELMVFWGADRVCTAAEHRAQFERPRRWYHPGRPETYLIFADYLVSCWEWAVVCAPGPDHGRIALMAGEKYDLFVYGSFSEMVEDYIASGDVVFAHRGVGGWPG